jgi:hypothetical protein
MGEWAQRVLKNLKIRKKINGAVFCVKKDKNNLALG